MLKICKKVDDYNTRISVDAERSFIRKIDGNCFTPLAVFAEINGKKLIVKGRLFSDNGKYFSEKKIVSLIKSPKDAGRLCAIKVLKGLNK